MIVILIIIIFILYAIGFCLTLKIDSMFCEPQQPTDYSALLNPIYWVAWLVVAIMILYTKHVCRSMGYTTDEEGNRIAYIYNEHWEY